jgi:regulator of replication initiation timing
MTGRPRNRNREPATKLVRLTPKQHRLMREFHRGKEPYGDTIARALQELDEIRKKVQAQKNENLNLHFEVERLREGNKNLLKIQRQQAERISEFEGIREEQYIRV